MPQANIEHYRRRMGWAIPWVSSDSTDFNVDFRVTTDEGERFGLSVFLRDGDSVFHTYFTSGRGVEALGSNWTFLDLTPLGRQEDWEDARRLPAIAAVCGGAATTSTTQARREGTACERA